MERKLTIIGDVHGKVNQYKEIIDNCQESICVGDFGFKTQWNWAKDNLVNLKHWINQGNHDDTSFRNSIPSIGKFSFYKNAIFTVAGADSIDKHLRREGVDWFPDEELSYSQGLECFDYYKVCKPKIVITHDCPQEVIEELFGYSDKSQTRNLLQAMFEIHQPEIWVFGHHHKSVNTFIKGTTFICLNELETIELEY